jgi:hypothetical protein
VEALGALLLVRGQLLLFLQWLEADACLAHAHDNYAPAFPAAGLVLLVGEGDADLGNAAGGVRGGWAGENGGFLVVDVDAVSAIGGGGDC